MTATSSTTKMPPSGQSIRSPRYESSRPEPSSLRETGSQAEGHILSYKTGGTVMSNQAIERKTNGQFAKGVSGNLGGNAQRSRHALNADTIREMHLAFTRGGRKAIDKVMKNNPAIFLKLLVLLVPREMKVEHTGGVKAMTDEQLEAGIEAITAMLAARDAGTSAKVIEGKVEQVPAPPKVRRKRRKTDDDVVEDVGREPEASNS
jgi:hypothetical protein